jgi:hypothetical protein
MRAIMHGLDPRIVFDDTLATGSRPSIAESLQSDPCQRLVA